MLSSGPFDSWYVPSAKLDLDNESEIGCKRFWSVSFVELVLMLSLCPYR
jgi:hypothetical protein